MRYRRWTQSEEDALRELLVAGRTDRQIAKEIRRTETAVSVHRGRMGLSRQRERGFQKRRWMVCGGMGFEIKEQA